MGVRTFIAVEIDDAVRQAVAAVIRDLAQAEARVKWVAPENLHVTVKFLGDIDDEDIPRACDILTEAVAGIDPFPVHVSGIGSFPPGRRPRIVWAGAREDGNGLKTIHARLDDRLQDIGVAPERRAFAPHVTLGRVKSPRGADRLVDLIAAAADRAFGTTTVEAVTLLESMLRPDGPIYTPLYRAAPGAAG